MLHFSMLAECYLVGSNFMRPNQKVVENMLADSLQCTDNKYMHESLHWSVFNLHAFKMPRYTMYLYHHAQ